MHNHQVYIALGSNLGNRSKHLFTATRLIEQRVGLVNASSRVYIVPAMGFVGDEFLNAVIRINTRLTAAECLNKLQTIERELGRSQRSGDTYENRPIDLDILYYDDEVIDDKYLQVPHPSIAQRNFVLQPLCDIASDMKHPILGESHKSLMEKLQSIVEISDVVIPLSRKRYPIQHFNFIAIEGNIGSGKTSLTHQLSADFNAKMILERFADNPFLPLFYKDTERYAFPLEMSFLADRYQQISDDLAQQDLFSDLTVADYYVIKSLIFSKITLEKEEYSLYSRLFHMMYKELVKPDLYVYLYQTEERLLENIKKRGRDYEQNIEASYLQQIQQGYANFIRTQNDLKVKVIDVSDIDFVNNQEDYIKVLDQITSTIS